VISMVDVLAGEGEVLVIENGASVRGAPVLGRGDVEVALPWAPEATAVFLATGVEVRAPLATGRFVRITSTLTLARVLEIAASLVAVEGPGEVVPLDDEVGAVSAGRSAPPARQPQLRHGGSLSCLCPSASWSKVSFSCVRKTGAGSSPKAKGFCWGHSPDW
jgi:hypothetical protein